VSLLSNQPHVLLAVPAVHAASMDELVQAWRDRGAAVSIETYGGMLPPVEQWLHESGNGGDDFSAALLVGPARRAPATVISAPFAVNRAGRRVPIAWLPATSAVAVRRFAATAARTHRRPRRAAGVGGVALLAQWQRQYLQVVDRMAVLVAPVAEGFRWTADSLLREDMVHALGSGLGLAIYVGHGRPIGWVGYHGMRSHHFDAFDGEPLGALLSLCCRTASRRRCGLSYAESLPLRGICSASLGAIGDTLHTDNTRWAVGLCDALRAGAQTIGELVARGAPMSPAAVASYRLIGDPLAPLVAASGGLRRARSVHLHA
jgi:hypothetical protein